MPPHLLTASLLCAAGAAALPSAAFAQHSKHPSKSELALATPPVTSVLPPAPLTGGSDDCALAASMNAITGPGNYAVDTTTATTGSTPAPTCSTFVARDVWFEWTSTFTGNTIITLCGHTLSDTILAVWTGAGCPVGTSTDCNDDACGLVSRITFATTAGGVYMIQVGMFNTTPGVVTSMDITSVAPPPNDDCSTPTALQPGDLIQPFNTTMATTGVDGQAEAANCTDYGQVGIGKDVWFTWIPTASGPVTLSTCGLMTFPNANADTKIAVYAGSACPAPDSSLACNDDAGHSPTVPNYTCVAANFNSTLTFDATCGQTYLFQIGQYPLNVANNSGAFQVTQSGSVCSVTTAECPGDTAAACPCSGAGGSGIPNPGAAGSGCANGVYATGAVLSAVGSAVDNPSDSFVLTCANMPGPGLFFQANGLVGPLLNFNDGNLCAGAGIVRMAVVFPAGGVGTYPSSLAQLPIHVAGAPVLTPNPTKHYQCWYRDNTPGFCNPAGHNLSNGLGVTWIP